MTGVQTCALPILLDINPETGKVVDYVAVARQLEEIRTRYGGADSTAGIDIHIIGFAKVVGDITTGARQIILFFLITFVVITLLVIFYAQSAKIALVPVACSVIAVVWQQGLLSLLGFGIDPMSILVPFLIFAIGVSHGVQMISTIRSGIYLGMDSMASARDSFRRLLLPGMIALVSDAAGFVTILYIDVPMIREMAINASIGVAVVILTNLLLLPVVSSFLNFDPGFQARLVRRANYLLPFWRRLAGLTRFAPARAVIAASLVLLGVGLWQATDVRIGDQQRGIPELRSSARYNQIGRAHV